MNSLMWTVMHMCHKLAPRLKMFLQPVSRPTNQCRPHLSKAFRPYSPIIYNTIDSRVSNISEHLSADASKTERMMKCQRFIGHGTRNHPAGTISELESDFGQNVNQKTLAVQKWLTRSCWRSDLWSRIWWDWDWRWRCWRRDSDQPVLTGLSMRC